METEIGIVSGNTAIETVGMTSMTTTTKEGLPTETLANEILVISGTPEILATIGTGTIGTLETFVTCVILETLEQILVQTLATSGLPVNHETRATFETSAIHAMFATLVTMSEGIYSCLVGQTSARRAVPRAGQSEENRRPRPRHSSRRKLSRRNA